MPFRWIGPESALGPDDLAFLQAVYEEAVESVGTVDDNTIHATVRSLIALYRAGERDRERLVGIAMGELRRAAG